MINTIARNYNCNSQAAECASSVDNTVEFLVQPVSPKNMLLGSSIIVLAPGVLLKFSGFCLRLTLCYFY